LAGNKKILIIDDEAPIRQVIALKLKNGGYDVLSATDGEEGLRVIQREAPDVVITDITMPRLDGKQLCEMTHHLKQERPFLTVVMTARIMPDERQWIDKMPDTLFMEKPFSPRQLLECIDNYFGVKR
jgi:CheY-like chemotaxis protein